MAIGLARMIGITLMDNFRRPYFARNISEFWRRWHISLSTWFRDYLFIPLGGSRAGQLRTNLNLLIVFFLCGMWHGAGWNFGIWGLYNAVLLWFYHAFRKKIDRINVVVQIFITFHLTCIGWIFFRAPTMQQATQMIASLFRDWQFSATQSGGQFVTLIILTSFVWIPQLMVEWRQDENLFYRIPHWIKAFCYIVMAIIILEFGNFSDRSFIYFQF